MLNFQDIPNSLGTSSLLMESKGHRIFFNIDNNNPGFIEIKKSGWTSFIYNCVINGEKINEATEDVLKIQENVFKVNIIETTLTTEDENNQISWYNIKTIRIFDDVSTTVHRFIIYYYKFLQFL
jgi:hypothetical protein